MFDTYGPFVWRSCDKPGFDDLFVQVDGANERLGGSIGVYVISATQADGQRLPFYVGQTYRGFWNRLKQHNRSRRFRDLVTTSGPLEVFLVARATPKGRVIRSTERIRKSRGLKSIDWLELQLIDHCLDLNNLLMNVSESTFHKRLHVPGFRDKGARREAGARALSKLLKIK